MNVLLIEPDAVLAKTYAYALRQAGHQVSHTYSAQQAIQLADVQKPDVVVLEIQLARHNSVEFLYEFRSYPEWADIPVILHTMIPPHKLAPVERVLKLMGVKAQLYKPTTSVKQLIKTLQNAVELVQT